ncbi:DUF523 domain-containing protein [Enterovibrio norvegicus]
MEKVLISACLLGQNVRYDGNNLGLDSLSFQRLSELVEFVAICPEVSGGLPTPRTPAEIIQGVGLDVIEQRIQVITQTGEDVTDAFILGAQNALDLCKRNNIRAAVLTDSSPSCGSSKIYNGEFDGEKVAGHGVTTALLRQHGIAVFSQFELENIIEFVNS